MAMPMRLGLMDEPINVRVLLKARVQRSVIAVQTDDDLAGAPRLFGKTLKEAIKLGTIGMHDDACSSVCCMRVKIQIELIVAQGLKM